MARAWRIPPTRDPRFMTDPDSRASSGAVGKGSEPKQSRLGQILAERPEARPQLRRAVGSLLATALVTIAAVGLLLIWHLRRRAQLIRDRLRPPRDVSLLDLSEAGDEKPRPAAGAPDSSGR
jgi:hypothetical protein